MSDETYRETYAALSWTAGDVQSVFPGRTIEECQAWMSRNDRRLRDRLCELGFEVIAHMDDFAEHKGTKP